MNAMTPIAATAVRIEGRDLVHGARRRRVEPRVVSLLRVLAAAEGRLVSREALLEACWGEEGSDEALTQAMAQLRKALGDDARAARFVETAPKRGYRWLAGPLGEAPSPAPRIAGPRPPRSWRLAAAVIGLSLLSSGGVAGVVAWLVSPPPPRMELVEEYYLRRADATARRLPPPSTMAGFPELDGKGLP